MFKNKFKFKKYQSVTVSGISSIDKETVFTIIGRAKVKISRTKEEKQNIYSLFDDSDWSKENHIFGIPEKFLEKVKDNDNRNCLQMFQCFYV